MKKVLAIVFVFFTFIFFGASVTLAVSPSLLPDSQHSEEVNSYELFWPIVAGKVRGDSFYSLKLFKEKIREGLIFNTYRKADYNIRLAEKRSVEAEKLLMVDKRYSDAKTTLDEAQQTREKALELTKKAETEGHYVVDLINTIQSSAEKQYKLFNYLLPKLPEDQASMLKEYITNISLFLSKPR